MKLTRLLASRFGFNGATGFIMRWFEWIFIQVFHENSRLLGQALTQRLALLILEPPKREFVTFHEITLVFKATYNGILYTCIWDIKIHIHTGFYHQSGYPSNQSSKMIHPNLIVRSALQRNHPKKERERSSFTPPFFKSSLALIAIELYFQGL